MDFKIALRMGTDRTDFRGFCTDYNMTAVPALPCLDLAFFKHGGGFHIL